jgi:hypothetical protein
MIGRMRYGKLWAEKYLNPMPDRIHSQPESVRCLWIEFFVRDIDSPWPGYIQVSPTMGYTDEQLSSMVNMAFLSYEFAKARLIEIREIAVLDHNRLQWLRHKETQSNYDRKLAYLAKKQQGTKKGTRKGTPKGTPKGAAIIENREDRIENKEEDKELSLVSDPADQSQIPLSDFVQEWNAHQKSPYIRALTPKQKELLVGLSTNPEFRQNWRAVIRGARQNTSKTFKFYLTWVLEHWESCWNDYDPETDWRRHECPIAE